MLTSTRDNATIHTTTLIGDELYLIGSLGYQDERAEKHQAQVMVLNLETFRMRAMATKGEDPGWLSHHRAKPLSPTSIAV